MAACTADRARSGLASAHAVFKLWKFALKAMAETSDKQLAVLLFTDIVGSVALQSKVGTDRYTSSMRLVMASWSDSDRQAMPLKLPCVCTT